MRVYTLKKRMAILFGVLFLFIPLGCLGLYLFIDSVCFYLSFPEVFVFSSFVIYGVTLILILTPLFFISVIPVFFGRMASHSIQRRVSNFIVFCFFFSIPLQIGFRFYFLNAFEERGYVKCQGIPSGWMPGMATKYAINGVLCTKKDP